MRSAKLSPAPSTPLSVEAMAQAPDSKEQRQRFIDAARELGCEEGFDRLDDALKRVGTTPPKPQETAPKRARAARQAGVGQKSKAAKTA